MDPEEKAKLVHKYQEEFSDDYLLELAKAHPRDYVDGVYEIICTAIKKRGLHDQLKMVAAPAPQSDETLDNPDAQTDQAETSLPESTENIKVITAYRARTVIEADFIKTLLDQAEITCSYSTFPLSAISPVGIIAPDALAGTPIFVRQDQAEEAKEIIKNFLCQLPDYYFNESINVPQPPNHNGRPFPGR